MTAVKRLCSLVDQDFAHPIPRQSFHRNMSDRAASIATGDGVDAEKIQVKADVATSNTPHFDYDASDVKKLVRKIDWRIMPFLWGYAVLSAVDVSPSKLDNCNLHGYADEMQKVIISNAALYGMKDDNKLAGQEYSWGMAPLEYESFDYD